MPPPPWTTPDQLLFLQEEDLKWAIAKAGTGTLKSFYTRTAIEFLKKWPVTPDAKTLAEAENDIPKAMELAETQLHKVSVVTRATSVL